jgi:hypothetical protein
MVMGKKSGEFLKKPSQERIGHSRDDDRGR